MGLGGGGEQGAGRIAFEVVGKGFEVGAGRPQVADEVGDVLLAAVQGLVPRAGCCDRGRPGYAAVRDSRRFPQALDGGGRARRAGP